ncbi:MAG: isopenicillin N synthase family oxygenase [Betaproteobacteria bacterium]|nr:MAG: isopenicillin N synthase family oxygenase [Betaproteobacteria bacterium]
MPIPSIKLGEALARGAPHAREVALALGVACETSGFCYVTEHGISDDLLNAQFALARSAFELPSRVREQVVQTVTATAPEGGALHHVVDQASGASEVLTLYECFEGGAGPVPPWSHAQMRAYVHAMLRLSRRLMQLVALSLELPEHTFDELPGEAVSVLRMLRYPPCAGVQAHTDAQALTVLAQDHHAGLEVQMDDGQWLTVEPREGALVVHPGDALSRWTRGRYRSRAHRVRSTAEEPRLSIPFFYSPGGLVQ